jgi:intein/homing endonuclease
MIDEGAEALNLFNIPYVIEDNGPTVNKEHKYSLRILAKKDSIYTYIFLQLIQSALPRKSYEKFLNYSPLKKSKIIDIQKLGIEPVYNIETECHTYIANGFCVHNCY